MHDALSTFQSSPVTKDGRYSRPVGREMPSPMFQSSPVTKDGRYHERVGFVRACNVSILARH